MSIRICNHIEYFIIKYLMLTELIKYINMYLLEILYEYQKELLNKFLEGMYRNCEYK